MPGHNTSFFILGVFILWFGWYGFNPGSQLGIVGYTYSYVTPAGEFATTTLGGNLNVTARCAVNTTLGAAFGLFGAFFYKMILEFIHSRTLVWDVMVAGNGTLAGLAAITAGMWPVDLYSERNNATTTFNPTRVLHGAALGRNDHRHHRRHGLRLCCVARAVRVQGRRPR